MASQSTLAASVSNLLKQTTVLQTLLPWLSIHRQESLFIQETLKVDYTPVFGDAIDLQRFAEIGKRVCWP